MVGRRAEPAADRDPAGVVETRQDRRGEKLRHPAERLRSGGHVVEMMGGTVRNRQRAERVADLLDHPRSDPSGLFEVERLIAPGHDHERHAAKLGGGIAQAVMERLAREDVAEQGAGKLVHLG